MNKGVENTDQDEDLEKLVTALRVVMGEESWFKKYATHIITTLSTIGLAAFITAAFTVSSDVMLIKKDVSSLKKIVVDAKLEGRISAGEIKLEAHERAGAHQYADEQIHKLITRITVLENAMGIKGNGK